MPAKSKRKQRKARAKRRKAKAIKSHPRSLPLAGISMPCWNGWHASVPGIGHLARGTPRQDATAVGVAPDPGYWRPTEWVPPLLASGVPGRRATCFPNLFIPTNLLLELSLRWRHRTSLRPTKPGKAYPPWSGLIVNSWPNNIPSYTDGGSSRDYLPLPLLP